MSRTHCSPSGKRKEEGGTERGDKAIVATHTSNSEHQFIFYGLRVPNLMPPRLKLD